MLSIKKQKQSLQLHSHALLPSSIQSEGLKGGGVAHFADDFQANRPTKLPLYFNKEADKE